MLLEIDVQGSRQVKLAMPRAVRIFITVRSMDELENRLEDRGTETPDQMLTRLRNAAAELRYAGECEHIIVNDEIEKASRELIALVKSYREK
jgi:guanylate kinase